MDHFAGLDVSVKETSICIVDDAGKIVREVKVASEPEALLAVLKNLAYPFKRMGLEAGPLSPWLFSGHRELAAPPELVRARRVRGEPRTRPLQPNLASGLSRERVEGRLGLALRRLVSRHMGLRLVLVRFRFLFFLISFLSLRHGDPPVCSLTGHSSTAREQ